MVKVEVGSIAPNLHINILSLQLDIGRKKAGQEISQQSHLEATMSPSCEVCKRKHSRHQYLRPLVLRPSQLSWTLSIHRDVTPHGGLRKECRHGGCPWEEVTGRTRGGWFVRTETELLPLSFLFCSTVRALGSISLFSVTLKSPAELRPSNLHRLIIGSGVM